MFLQECNIHQCLINYSLPFQLQLLFITSYQLFCCSQCLCPNCLGSLGRIPILNCTLDLLHFNGLKPFTKLLWYVSHLRLVSLYFVHLLRVKKSSKCAITSSSLISGGLGSPTFRSSTTGVMSTSPVASVMTLAQKREQEKDDNIVWIMYVYIYICHIICRVDMQVDNKHYIECWWMLCCHNLNVNDNNKETVAVKAISSLQ